MWSACHQMPQDSPPSGAPRGVSSDKPTCLAGPASTGNLLRSQHVDMRPPVVISVFRDKPDQPFLEYSISWGSLWRFSFLLPSSRAGLNITVLVLSPVLGQQWWVDIYWMLDWSLKRRVDQILFPVYLGCKLQQEGTLMKAGHPSHVPGQKRATEN